MRKNDYKVNLKTEIMIEDLYDKVNAILAKQSQIEKLLTEKKDGRRGNKEIKYRQIKKSGSANMMWLCFITQNIRI